MSVGSLYRSPITYGINTDHAPVLLRKDVLEHLSFLKSYCGFTFARCHGVLDDSIHVASRVGDDSAALPTWAMVDGVLSAKLRRPKKPNELRFHFEQAHKVFGNLLEVGYTPMVELSFLPRALAADPAKTCCHYRGLCSHPASYREWGSLIEALARSLVRRFGLREVRRWRFTVWNEPNGGFWFPAGDKFEAYMRLYEAAARGLKRASPRLEVGGPATMVAGWAPPDTAMARGAPLGRGGPSEGEGWVESFVRRCLARRIPLDFVETHLYPMDEYELYKEQTRALYGPFDFFPRTIAKVNAAVERLRPGTDVIWGEWSSNHRVVRQGLPPWDRSLSPVTFLRNAQFDTPFGGAYAARIAGTFLAGEKMCWWVGTDIYEECGWRHQPYHCGYGLLNIHGFPKPSANAHHFAHRLDGGRILARASEDGAGFLSVRKGRENLLLAWNWIHPERAATAYTLDLRRVGFRVGRGARIALVDDAHANGRAVWHRLGRPDELDPRAERAIRAGSALAERPLASKAVADQALRLEPNGFALIVDR
jgi:xylan 1,4-beta-xylosidase